MILDFLEGPIDGDSWEKLCNSCCRMKYQAEHYTEIPAIHGGDAGIEGFTCSGRVFQCYCPEREYNDDELHEHLRGKMTDDINKLVNLKYAQRLKELGVPKIKEWHFVIPQYRDSRIIQHAERKRQEILDLKKNLPREYEYIDDDFLIVIKQAEDFKLEISKIIRTTLTDVKLNFAICHTGEIDWSKCESEKVENIKRKVKAVMEDIPETDEDYKSVVDMYIESYIKGLEILRMLRISFAEVYEQIIIANCKCKLNTLVK